MRQSRKRTTEKFEKPCRNAKNADPRQGFAAGQKIDWKLDLPGMSKCPKCGEMKLAHRMCKACGYYNGREVVAVKEA